MRRKMSNRTFRSLTLALLLTSLLLLTHAVSAQTPSLEQASTRNVQPAPPSPRTGFVAPAVDLSHLTARRAPQQLQALTVPGRWDWRDHGMVTSVKNQGACGSCYAFAALANLESKLLMDGAGAYDFSENNAKECNWYEVTGTYGGTSCSGGNYMQMVNLFTKKGTVLESCDPYVDRDIHCESACPYQRTLLDWRIISGDSVPSAGLLKQYLYDYGPLYTTIYAGDSDAWESEFRNYDGSYTLHHTGGGWPNHAVLIVGWDDGLTHAGGSGAWIVKNSWGTGWGDSGTFTIAYGSASIGMFSSFAHSWQDYDSSGQVLHYDEGGWSNSWGCTGSTTAWGLVEVTPQHDVRVTAVEFWTTDATTDVDVYVYDSFDGTAPGTLLAQELNNAYAEAGYHSVSLSSPVSVGSGDDVVAVVKLSNADHGLPVPADQLGPSETGRTYISCSGSSGTWTDLGSYDSDDVAIRLRTTRESGACGDPHEPNDDPAAATSIAYGDVLTDPTICPAGDEDYYAFSGSAGDLIIADVDARSLSPASQLDAYLYLLDAGGAEIARNDDYDGLDSRLQHRLPADGTYYLKVREYDHAVEGGTDYVYTLTLDERGAGPDIDVSPASLQASAPNGQSTRRSLTIANVGAGPLDFQLSERDTTSTAALLAPRARTPSENAVVGDTDVPWLSASPTSGTVAGGSGQNVIVTFDGAALSPGTYTAEIVAGSNDPDENPVIVPVTFNVGESLDRVVMTIEDSAGSPGSTGNPVTVSADNQSANTTPLGGAQLRLVYDGTTGLTLADVKTTARSSGFETSWTLDESTAAAVEAQILLYNPTGGTIGSGTGPILELLFDVNSSASGDAASLLSFSNVLLSDGTGDSIPADFSDTGQFSFDCARDGDVNDDGHVNIFDLQIVVNMILHAAQPDPDLYPPAWWCRADLAPLPDGDGHWTIFDLQRLIRLIIAAPANRGISGTSTEAGNVISFADVYAVPGSSGAFDITCQNQDTIASAQIRFTYDATTGFRVSDVVSAARTEEMSVDLNLDDSDPSAVEALVLLYDATGRSSLKEGSGSILSVASDVAADAEGNPNLAFTEVLLSDASAHPLTRTVRPGQIHIQRAVYLPLVIRSAPDHRAVDRR